VLVVDKKYSPSFRITAAVPWLSGLVAGYDSRPVEKRFVVVMGEFFLQVFQFFKFIYHRRCVTLAMYSVVKLDVLLTVHHTNLICLLGVNAFTCFGRYSPIFSRLWSVAVWCNYVCRVCVNYVQVVVPPQPARS
jgi:hypothetical protein